MDAMAEKIERPHFSWSQLQMYIRCSFMYMFRYQLGLPERKKLYMSNGTAGHSAVEQNALHKIETGEDQPIEQILENYDNALDAELQNYELGDLSLDDDPLAVQKTAHQVLTAYRTELAPKVQPIAVEVPFELELPPTEEYQYQTLPVVGIIDSIAKLDRTGVWDNKFPTKLPSYQQETADMNDQLTIYDMGAESLGHKIDTLGFIHFVPPTKTLASRIIPVERSAYLLEPEARGNRRERLIYKLRTAARGIAQGNFIPVDQPTICGSCGYRDICQKSLVKNDYEAMQVTQQGAQYGKVQAP